MAHRSCELPGLSTWTAFSPTLTAMAHLAKAPAVPTTNPNTQQKQVSQNRHLDTPLLVEAFSSLKNERHSRAKRHHLTYAVFTIYRIQQRKNRFKHASTSSPQHLQLSEMWLDKKMTPRSDALMPSEYFSECPTCGCGTLTHRNVSSRSTLIDQLNVMIDRLSSKVNK